MSSRKDVTWKAKPHTIAKIKILENYLVPYFQILGRTNPGEEIIYVDGFAGPGKYENYPSGSPVAALRSAAIVFANAGSNFKAKGITCIFVEKSKKRFASLTQVTDAFEKISRLSIVRINSGFSEASDEIQSKFPTAFTSGPSFFFIDPFGVSQTPFSLIKKILRNPKSEVFINFNAPGLNRIVLAGEQANAGTLVEQALGKTADRKFLGESTDERARLIFQDYQTNVKDLPGVQYVFPFEMRSKSDLVEYFLLFAGHHFLGLEKMKEAMKKIAGNSSYIFSDAHQGMQHEMFEDDSLSVYSSQMSKKFEGSDVTYQALRDYALNETPFVNSKGMLRLLESEGKIVVQVISGVNRRKGDLPEEKIAKISFQKYARNLFN